VPRGEAPVFTDLDLYLMGLASADEIREHIVFADQDAARTRQCNGLFTGETIRVGIEDIIGAVGSRVPDSTTALNRFKIATIVVSRNGLLTDDEMAFFDFFARRAEATDQVPYQEGFVKGTSKPFWISTGGRASLDARLTSDIVLNHLVSLSVLTTSFDAAPGPSAPAGTFTITASFTNIGSVPLVRPFFRVTELSGGNVLLNADGGRGGVGASLTPGVGSDGILSPGESVTVGFVVGLQAREPFTFTVNVLGVGAP
jgi:hypothetical protein